MRIRQVRREFWTDRRVALLPKSTRLFYIGLWAVADDDGYLAWDLPQISGELFPFDPVRARERDAHKDGQRLVDAGRVLLLGCGRHARIPTLTEHQKIGGDKSFAFRNEHATECSIELHRAMEQSPSNVTVGNVTVGNGRPVAAPPNGSAAGDLRDKTGIDPDEAFGPRRHLRKVS